MSNPILKLTQHKMITSKTLIKFFRFVPAMSEESVDCLGVIFQFNSDGVLFEFSDRSADDAIGFVNAADIKINENETIPAADADSTELLSKYIQVGDELRCTVVKDSNLPVYSYLEDEEEIDESGEIQTTSRRVEINPDWIARSAKLVVPINDESDEKDPNPETNSDRPDVEMNSIPQDAEVSTGDVTDHGNAETKTSDVTNQDEVETKTSDVTDQDGVETKTSDTIPEGDVEMKTNEDKTKGEVEIKTTDVTDHAEVEAKTGDSFPQDEVEMKTSEDNHQVEVEMKTNETALQDEAETNEEVHHQDEADAKTRAATVPVQVEKKTNGVSSQDDIATDTSDVTKVESKADYSEFEELKPENIFLDEEQEMLDYEDDVIFSEDINFEDLDEDITKTEAKADNDSAKTEQVLEEKENAKKVEEVEKSESKVLKEKTPEKVKTKVAPKQAVTEETFIEKARIVQLVKPVKEGGKVVTAIFQIDGGQFKNSCVTVSNSCIYVHGHHLGLASLVCSFSKHFNSF